MIETIFIGDPHVVPDELDDCENLLRLVEEVAGKHPDAAIVFLGDQHDKHAIVHLKVIAFWRRWFARLGGKNRCFALVGNHDREVRAAAVGSPNVMESYLDVCNVALPAIDMGPLTLVSHEPDPVTFANLVSGCGLPQVLVCHQTFLGSPGAELQSDAMMAPPVRRVISGHLHSPHSFDVRDGHTEVWYPGAPRWRTITDAQHQGRAVWWTRFTGSDYVRRPYYTSAHCRPIMVLEDTPEEPIDPATLLKGTDWRVNVRGDRARVAERCALLKAHAVPRPFPDRAEAPAGISERQPPEEALERFLGVFQPPRGTSPERMRCLIQEAMAT